ncbi:hypothetical protein L6270_03450 [Candidatus Parcubacteria bacterium]|nr:hypothetical protein [Patescibacteria group bacterium]MBU4309019.1 hypothetical protein [Patescibacteria group bacterium]MBU4432386.1 hypothetical protein [Patescibacteria group bacterium]MBU4577380.1 hypothetical protein [Patescibacteria group bacterium]MCG2697068.1 hypothetical protein [Candidatus Parcubacteria bacterium]
MSQTNEDLKVSVTNEGGEKRGRKPKKRIEAERMDQIERPKARVPKEGMKMTVISVVITAIVVGGGLYAWQREKINSTVNSITEEARNTRVDLEKKLTNIKDKAQGLQTEVEELKSKNEKLSEAEALLANAKIEFNNTELGIKFEYPASLGEAKITIENGEGGKTIKGTFSKNDKLVFGGVSKNYQKQGSSTVTELLDFQGYKDVKKTVYFLAPSSNVDGYEMTTAGEVVTGKGKAFLLNDKSFAMKASSTEAVVNIGQNLAAVVNITNPDFGGIIFVNSDFGMMSVDNFKKLIGSIK